MSRGLFRQSQRNVRLKRAAAGSHSDHGEAFARSRGGCAPRGDSAARSGVAWRARRVLGMMRRCWRGSPHPLLLTTDALVEGVHFRREWLSSWELGRRAFHVAASDVAAMGGRVRAVLFGARGSVGLAGRGAPRRRARRARRGRARGGGARRRQSHRRHAQLSLTVSVLGDAPARPLLRAGARKGDQLYVTGRLGGAALGLRLLAGARTVVGGETARRCWRRPVARLQAGRAIATAGIASAMMDLSDGLLVDAGRLARASRCGLVIEAERVPLPSTLRALDLRTAARARARRGRGLRAALRRPAAASRAAGARAARLSRHSHRRRSVPDAAVTVVDAAGRPVAHPGRPGHEHFRS